MREPSPPSTAKAAPPFPDELSADQCARLRDGAGVVVSALNTGILPFLSYDVIYNLDPGAPRLTLVPQQVPTPAPLLAAAGRGAGREVCGADPADAEASP